MKKKLLINWAVFSCLKEEKSLKKRKPTEAGFLWVGRMNLADAEPGDGDVQQNASPRDEGVGEIALLSAIDGEEASTNRP